MADFPYFFNPNVDIVFDNSLVFNSQFEDSVKLKEALEKIDRKVTFKDEIGQENDVIFVGRFDETEVVEDYLAEAKIAILNPVDAVEEAETETEESQDSRLALISDEAPGPEDRFIDGRIRVEGIGDLERGGSTLFSLQQEGGRNVMITVFRRAGARCGVAWTLRTWTRFTLCKPTKVVRALAHPTASGSPHLRLDRREVDHRVVRGEAYVGD